MGALYTVTSKLSKAGINILSSFHSEPIDREKAGKVCYWFAFIEVPEKVFLKKISKILLNFDAILDMKYEELGKTECFSKFLFPLYIRDDRVVILTTKTLHAMIREIVDLLTASGGGIILYRQGLAAGDAAYDEFLKEIESVDEKSAFVQSFLRTFGRGYVNICYTHLALTLETRVGVLKIENVLGKLSIVFDDVIEYIFGESVKKAVYSYIEIKTKDTNVRINRNEMFDYPENLSGLLKELFGDATYELIEKAFLKALSERFDVKCDEKQSLAEYIRMIKN